ncbi:MAG: hypothetical protein QOG43_1489 [Actinomycetota bacterium]|jgi:hypothetical protein|nr:hypothetical protein [Actinomycetota bacterium]
MRHRTITTALGLALLAAAVGACGSGGGSVDAGSTPTRPATTVAGSPATTAPDGAPGSTTATSDVILYFTRGEKIVKVTRTVPKVTRIGAETVKALVGGPTTAESADGLGTAIPPATRFRDLAIADGVAKVDLSKDFESGGGSLSLSLRLAQVTCTLDQFDSVTGVRFLLDGDLVNVFSGNGIILDQPVGCGDYADYVDGAPVSAVFPGIWPFTSQAEMDGYLAGADRTFTSPVETAKAFGARYLGMASPAVFGSPTPAAGGRVEVKLGFTTGEGGTPIVDPQPTMSVFLMSGGADGDQGPWTVVGASSPQIVVSQPVALDRVTSPVAVRGQAATFEGNVLVEVREDGMLAGANLGSGPVTGRGDGVLGPFSGDIAFKPPSKPAGAILFSEKSALDGQTVRATVVRVTF